MDDNQNSPVSNTSNITQHSDNQPVSNTPNVTNYDTNPPGQKSNEKYTRAILEHYHPSHKLKDKTETKNDK